MGTPLQVLVLEDSPADAELVLHALRAAGYDPQATVVDTEPDYLAHLDDGLELIIADYSLPQFTAKAALGLLLARGLDIPFIVVTGIASEEAAVETMKLGAANYLLKDRLARLGPAVAGALEQKRLQHEMVKAEQGRLEADELYRGLFENVSVGFCLTRADGGILAVNQALLQSCGYSQGERPRLKTLSRLLETPRTWRKIMQDLKGQEEIHQRVVHLKHRDGSSHEALLTAYFVGSGESRSVLWAFEDVSEWVRSERALQESRAEMAGVFESAIDAILMLDEQHTITRINGAAERIFGYPPAALTGRPLASILTPESLAAAVSKSGTRILPAQQIARLIGRQVEVIGRRSDGGTFPAELAMSHFLLRGQQRSMVIIRDISERKSDEAALRTEKEKAQEYLDIADVILLALDPDRKVLMINRKGCEILGRRQEDILGQDWFTIALPERVRENLGAEFAKVKEQSATVDEVFENPIVTSRGEERLISWHNRALRDENGNLRATLSSGEDVTVRRKAEQALQESESRYRNIFEGVRDAIFVEGQEGEILEVNARACEMYGWSREQFLQMNVKDLIRPDDTLLSPEVFVDGRTLNPIETSNRRADGEWIPVQVTARLQTLEGVERLLVSVRDMSAIKETETALRETESNYRSIFEGIQDAVLVETLDGRIIDANARACEMYGWKREDLLQKWVTDLVPADVPILRAAGLQEGKTIRPFESVNRRANGETFPAQIMARLQLFEGVARLLVVIRDITEMKKAEEEVRRRAEHLEALNTIIGASSTSGDVLSLLTVALNSTLKALSSTMGLVWAGSEWTWAGVMKVLGEHMQREVAARPGMFTVSLAMDDWQTIADDKRLAPMAKSIIDEGVRATIFAPIVLGDQTIGGLIVAEDRPRSWNQQEIGLVEAVARQLGGGIERVRLLRRTRDQALQLQSVLDSISEGVLVLDSRGAVLVANPLAQQYLEPLAAYDDSGSLIMLGDLELKAVLTAGAGQGTREVTSTETPPRVFEIQSSLAWLDPGTTGWAVVLRDVTEQRRAETEAEHQRRLAAVGQLAAGIAHDFNNIVGAIILHTEMLRREPGLSEKGLGRLTTIVEQSQRATRLIQQVLDFSRKTIIEKQPFDLEVFLVDLVGLLQRTLPESIRVSFDQNGEDYYLLGDPTRMQQVITNLAVNARDAMPNGGNLSLRLSHFRLDPGSTRPFAEMTLREWIKLDVSDTGEGIKPGDLPHVFEPFFSTKGAKGSGLGLAQVFGIIKQHDGFVNVGSRPGAGTTFTIYLPAYELPSLPVAPLPGTPVQKGNGETILIVEDNSPMREAMAELLRAIGYRVLEAGDGQEALSILERSEEGVKLVISDLVMPEMGGRELADRIKAEYPHVHTVLMTGYPLGDETVGLQGLRATSWIQKPVDLGTLAMQVRKALDDGLH